MKVAVAVLPNGMVNAHFGRANRIAFAVVEEKEIKEWTEEEAPFAATHGEDSHDHHPYDHDDHPHEHQHGHGHHSANHQEIIKNYLVDHGVDLLLVDHAGPGLKRVLQETKIKVVTGARGRAREVVQAVIDQGFTE
ncbi:NifB/NifX family molybdenum-iron cluster-binding protein [Thermicanus aegyptius]|uniref:NifB/NifX family molybdenum-iron cluster-binding protein n=1 Tax=Thermicanus aegyptius TaxID=94009 RepID=UPI000429F56F|nr:NifB/NifX family molybdenum-iron cluster-binding protein [Thermicanus aegyptius]